MPNENLSENELQLQQLKSELSQKQSYLQNAIKDMFKESFPDLDSMETYEKDLENLKNTIQKEINSRNIQNKLLDEITKKEQEQIKLLEDKIRVEEEAKIKEQKKINSINKLIAGDIKSAAQEFIGTFSKTGKMFADILMRALGIVEKISKMQAEMNKASIALGMDPSKNGFFNIRSLEDKAILTATLGSFNFNSDQRNKIAFDYARQYDVNSFNRRQNFNNIETLGAAQKYFTALGVDEGAVGSLTEGAIIREGMSSNQFNQQYFNQITQAQKQSGISYNKFINFLNQVEKEGRSFGMTLQDAIQYVAKFGKEIDKGTISLGQLSVYNRTFAEGSTSLNAGIGMQLLQSGNLPTEALKFAGNPLALAGWIRNNAGNEKLQKGLENQVRQEAMMQGIEGPEALGEYFRLRYQQAGFSLSKKQYDILASGGSLSGQLKTNNEVTNEENANLISKAIDTAAATSSMGENIARIWELLKDAEVLRAGKNVSRAIEDTKQILNGDFNKEQLKQIVSDTIVGTLKKLTDTVYTMSPIKQLEVLVDVTGKVKTEVKAPNS